MKASHVVLAAMLLTVMSVPAWGFTELELPTYGGGFEQTPVYDVNPDGTIGEPATLARAWRQGQRGPHYCNANAGFGNNFWASMAQWMSLIERGGQAWWRILKPGDYAMWDQEFVMRSNGDVNIHVTNISSMRNDEGDVIPTKFAFTQMLSDGAGGWVPAPPEPWQWFDEDTAPISTLLSSPFADGPDVLPTIPEDEEHNARRFALWYRATPDISASACRYHGWLNLEFILAEQKAWVDPETGDFVEDYPPPNTPPGSGSE